MEFAPMLSLQSVSIVPILLTLAAVPVHAASTAADCAASGDPLHCRLVNVLHLLYAVAGVLAVVLIAIGVIAWTVYRRNRTWRLEEGRKE